MPPEFCEYLGNNKMCDGNEKICCYFCENAKDCVLGWPSKTDCKKYNTKRWCSTVKSKAEKDGFYKPNFKPRKIKGKFIGGQRVEQF